MEEDNNTWKGWEGVNSTNKGWTEGERKTRVDVFRNNDIKMAKAWMIY